MSEAKSMSAAAAPAKSARNPGANAATIRSKHPSYATMIIKALSDLAERKGSSRQAIVKYVLGTYDLDGPRAVKLLSGALKAQMEAGSVINASGTGLTGRFKLSPAMKTQLTKAKKAESKEESGNVKKSAPKKSDATKPKNSAVKPKQSVKKPSANSAKPKSALKSPKKKVQGKLKAASKSNVMKTSLAMSGKKASKTADPLESQKPKKSAPTKAGKKAQTVGKKGTKVDY